MIFCASFGVVWGIYKIESAYYRLRHKIDRSRRERLWDARQIALSVGAINFLSYAEWLLEGGPLPQKHWFMYARAMRWEFYQVAICTGIARLAKYLLF